MTKIKKGDQVLVTVGKDRGRKGKVEKIFPKTDRVLIPGVNVYKRHTKPRGEKQPGGIVEVVKPLPISNVALVCSKCSRPTRVGYRVDKQNKKHRICRKCQTLI
ncbi:50S ribosomal protein L24 [Patescibacteria group bacterium]